MVRSIVWYVCHVPWKSDIFWENANWRRHKTQSHFSICFFRLMQQLYRTWQVTGRLFWSSSSADKRNSVLNALESYCNQSRSYLVTPRVNSSIFSTYFFFHANITQDQQGALNHKKGNISFVWFCSAWWWLHWGSQNM